MAQAAEGLTVGFVGLGNMGVPMARNLREAGHPLIVHDAERARAEGFVERHGGQIAAEPAEFAAAAVVVTMLPDGRAVAQALLEWRGGIAAALGSEAVIVDMSSSSPIDTRTLGATLAERGLPLVDAPVSGGVRRAETGTLTIMAGADDPRAIDTAEPLFAVLGERTFRTGPLGSGHAMKALNNYCGGAAYAVLAEALAVGAGFGLSSEVMIDVINTSTGRSFNSEVVFAGEVLSGRYGTGFALALLAKDVGIAAALAESSGLQTPLCSLVAERLAQASAALGAGADHSEAHRAWWEVPLTAAEQRQRPSGPVAAAAERA
jgi:3-hydroxyisobutyrate dehydrogenase